MTQGREALWGGIGMTFIWELVGAFSYSHCTSQPVGGWCDFEFGLWTLFGVANLVIYGLLAAGYLKTKTKFILALIDIFFIGWLFFLGQAIFQIVRYL